MRCPFPAHRIFTSLPDFMKKAFSYISALLPYIFVFLASLFRPADTDLGWHLKYGEHFIKTGEVLRENTFSAEMADFRWANIAWITDIFSYLLFRLGGFFALSLAGAAVVTATFFLFSRAFKVDYWQKAVLFPLLIFYVEPLNRISFRGQLMSVMLLGVLLYLLEKYKEGSQKALLFVPLLFLIWANIHGQFILGLGVLFLWLFADVVESVITLRKLTDEIKKKVVRYAGISILSLLFPVIHPFGIGIYEDAIIHFHNPLLKSIAEYVPPEELSTTWINQLFMAIFLIIGIMTLVIQKRWKNNFTSIIPSLLLYSVSLSVKRYAWSMYYLAIPLLKPLADFFRPPTKRIQRHVATGIFLGLILLTLLIKHPLNQFLDMNWDVYCQKIGHCSPQGAEELKKYYIAGKTMTLYDWGGWLIWNYPDIKPSTDGRMHLWEKDGYSGFRHDYNIEQNIADLHFSKYEVVFTSKDKPIYSRLQELENEGLWRKVFEDQKSVIFTRVSPTR